MKIFKVFLVLCGLAVNGFAHENGIYFRDFESWQAVVETSKKENKPIFIDFFATWCGPCKVMDTNVYPDVALGEFFNQHFISIKVQMDKTIGDSEQVKKWYPEIKKLKDTYGISSFPTLVFVSSKGTILNKLIGSQQPAHLIKIAEVALRPGQKYVNPTTQYYDLIKNYKNGSKSGYALVKALHELQESNKYQVGIKFTRFSGIEMVIDTLSAATLSYLRTLPQSSLYTKEILETVGIVGIDTTDPLFTVFYSNASKVDRIVEDKGFAQLVVDRAIRREYFKMIPNVKHFTYKSAIKWDSLHTIIKNKYDKEYADRALIIAKAAVNFQEHEIFGRPSPQYNAVFFEMIQKYGPKVLLVYEVDMYWPRLIKKGGLELNQNALIEVFCTHELLMKSCSSEDMEKGIKIMKIAVEESEKSKSWYFPEMCATYASLLSKSGNDLAALKIAQKGIDFGACFTEEDIQSSVAKCKLSVIEINKKLLK